MSTMIRAAISARTTPSVLLVSLIAVGAIAFYLSGPLGADVSGLITLNELMLSGQSLYKDIFEPNPPMAAYLYSGPVLVARVLGVAPETLTVLYTVCFGLITTGFAARMIASAKLVKSQDLLWPVLMLLVGVGWGEHFAQREHFAAMSMLPVLASMAYRATGQEPTPLLWIVAGLCGGLVLAIKPHFALAILLPALFVVWRQRRVDRLLLPEYFLAGGLFIAFITHIFVFYPDFFGKSLPTANSVYVSDRRSLIALSRTPVAVLFAAMLLFGVIAYGRRVLSSDTLGLLFWSAIGFWLCYLLQGRGFTYHLMPAVVLLGSCIVLSFTERTNGSAKGLDAVLTLAATISMVAVPLSDNINQWRIYAPLVHVASAYGSGITIANLSADLRLVSPLARLLNGRVNVPAALLLSLSAQRLKQDLHPTGAWLEKIDAIEAAERTSLREDFVRHPPDIIVTWRGGFDWLSWARVDLEFAALLADFEQFDQVPFDDDAVVFLRRKGLHPDQS